MGFFGGLATGVVGAFSEAWAEVRVHRGRVLLSLIGVGVAVCALTAVVAAGSVAEQALRETSERSGGRAATMGINAFTDDGSILPAEDIRTAFRTAVDRYDIGYASEHGYGEQQVRLPGGRQSVPTETVDIPFGQMHRVPLLEGEWFTTSDERRLAPALVVNERLWESIGSPDLRSHPTLTLSATNEVTAVVVGVTPSPSFDLAPSMFMLASQARALQSPEQQALYGTPQFEVWVPADIAEPLGARRSADIRGQLGDGVQVDAFRNDYGEQNAESLRQVQLIIGGIALLVLLLGALGLVNIALVTVRTRIREIGVRRTFGATAGRVFLAVMLESVVATVAAGVVGVMLAVLLIRNPITTEFLAQGITDVPPFPMSAAVVGLIAATAVGALAGLIPALVAVRVKVIDAIRY
jgi:putative ABC transport system permease protein